MAISSIIKDLMYNQIVFISLMYTLNDHPKQLLLG
jgi:hypothetical protein